MESQPRYSGLNRSGICKCGHSWEEHHLGMVMNQDYFQETNEAYVPEECEYFGVNELGGMQLDGTPHCDSYRDSMENDGED